MVRQALRGWQTLAGKARRAAQGGQGSQAGKDTSQNIQYRKQSDAAGLSCLARAYVLLWTLRSSAQRRNVSELTLEVPVFQYQAGNRMNHITATLWRGESSGRSGGYAGGSFCDGVVLG